jgi:tetratricopeptide (TPR) repeat protein
MKTLRIDDIEGLPVLGTLVWQPVRKPLGITAFGINAYTAGDAGDEVVEDHTELVDEEVYIVIRGHAVFTVDGEEIDAPWGTIVFLDDLNQRRHAIAKEAGTTVLAIGGRPGVHPISSWEYIFPSLPARNAGDWDTARAVLEEAVAERPDVPAIRYHLAAVEARAGNTDRAIELLRAACEERPDYADAAANEDDFESIRDDPRFPAARTER